MRTAEEALTEGIVRVRRPDAAELLAVRRGEWSYERLMAVAEDIDARLSGLEAMSPLPKTIDMAKVGGVVMQVYQRIWDVREGRTRVAVRAPADRIKGAPDPLERLVYVDVEMTGYASEEARVVEVAAVEVLGGLRTGRVFHTYVNPDADINWHAFRMHGLTRDFLKDKPGMGEIADGLLAFIGGSPMMMHGASDDIAALNHDLGLAGSPLLDRGQAFDSQRIARQLFSGTAMSLDTLCDTVDRSARDRGHTAILDATLLAECGLKMAMMEGYASIQNAGLRRRAERKLNTAPSRPFVRDVDVTISGDGRTAVFVLPDGTRLEAAVPDCPDTHRIIAHQHSGAVLVLPAAALDGGGRDHRPDNPEGPAVLVCRGRAVERMWFSHGRPVRPPEHAAPGCGHGM